jgi:hypothetical protein
MNENLESTEIAVERQGSFDAEIADIEPRNRSSAHLRSLRLEFAVNDP